MQQTRPLTLRSGARFAASPMPNPHPLITTSGFPKGDMQSLLMRKPAHVLHVSADMDSYGCNGSHRFVPAGLPQLPQEPVG